MGKKNLKAQLHYAVQSAFKGNSQQNGGFGASKHADMAANQKNGKQKNTDQTLLHIITTFICIYDYDIISG